MKIYVGNLPMTTTEDELRNLFASYGEVRSANVIKDRMTGESRGFGFVEMGTADEAKAAIEGLDRHMLNERPLRVSEAREREDRGSRGGGFNRGGGNRNGGGSGGFRSGPSRDGGNRRF